MRAVPRPTSRLVFRAWREDDPVAAELEAALALRRTGADPKALRRALRRIEALLDE